MLLKADAKAQQVFTGRDAIAEEQEKLNLLGFYGQNGKPLREDGILDQDTLLAWNDKTYGGVLLGSNNSPMGQIVAKQDGLSGLTDSGYSAKLEEAKELVAQSTPEEIQEKIEKQGEDYVFKVGNFELLLEKEVTYYEGKEALKEIFKQAGGTILPIASAIISLLVMRKIPATADLGKAILAFHSGQQFAESSIDATWNFTLLVEAIMAYINDGGFTVTSVHLPGSSEALKLFLSFKNIT